MITDGILEHATAEELKSFLIEHGPSEKELAELIAELNSRGGYDNMTIMTLKLTGYISDIHRACSLPVESSS